MKWALNHEGKKAFIGYDLVAENEKDKLALGTIRNWKFWGIDDEHPVTKDMDEDMEYAGIDSEGNYVLSISWCIPRNVQRLKDGELKNPFEELL